MFDQLVHLLAREGDAGVERPADPTERGLDLDDLSRATMLNPDPDSAARRESRQVGLRHPPARAPRSPW